MITLYGIKNCDTVKRARSWLEDAGVDYEFHDFRAEGLRREKLEQWLQTLGVETLVNKRSATWKQLDASTRDRFTATTAVSVILANPTLIKRPVLEAGEQILVGFDNASYSALFKQHTL